MSEYTDLLKRLDEAHTEEQKFNRETYGEREFDPEEPTLHSEAAEAIRKLTAPVKPLEFGRLVVGDRVKVLVATNRLEIGEEVTVTKFDSWVGEEYPYIVIRDDGQTGAFARHELRRIT